MNPEPGQILHLQLWLIGLNGNNRKNVLSLGLLVFFLHFHLLFRPHELVVYLDFYYLLNILQHYYFRFRPREPVVHLDFYGFLSAMFAIGLAIGVTIAVGMLFCIQVNMLWLYSFIVFPVNDISCKMLWFLLSALNVITFNVIALLQTSIN